MATLSTSTKRISEYVVDRGRVKGKDVCIKRVLVKNGTSKTVDPLGLAVIVDGAGAWKFFVNTDDIAAVVGTGGIGGAKVGIIVGSNEGYGRNQEPMTFDSSGAQVHVLFGVVGNAIVKTGNIDWSVTDTAGAASVTPADAGEQSEFVAQLELQGVANQAVAAAIDPTFVA